MKTRVVVLDWDGVLCDSAEIYAKHFNEILRMCLLAPYSLQDFRERIFGATAEETLRRAGVTENNIPEARRRFIALTRGEPRPALFWDVHDTLRWLHHRFIETHIVSAHPTEDIVDVLDEYNLKPWVMSVSGNSSPEQKIEILSTFITGRGIRPDELVFVDDIDATLESARRIGCYRVASARGYCSYERLLKARPDKIIRNLKNLQGFINLIHHSQPQNLPENTTIRKASGK